MVMTGHVVKPSTGPVRRLGSPGPEPRPGLMPELLSVYHLLSDPAMDPLSIEWATSRPRISNSSLYVSYLRLILSTEV